MGQVHPAGCDGDSRLDVNEFHAGTTKLWLEVTWAATVRSSDPWMKMVVEQFCLTVCAWCARRGAESEVATRRTNASRKKVRLV